MSSAHDDAASTPADCSVLIITGGRDLHLARTLAGLERSEPRPAEVVVVFMDQPDGAVPETTLNVRVGYVNSDEDHGGLPLAAARNRAAALATKPSLVFLDVDCIPSRTAVRELTAEVQRHPDALVMGSPRYLRPGWDQVLLNGTSPDKALRDVSEPHAARAHLTPGPTEEWHMVWTLVLAVSAQTHAVLGGFDNGFTGYGAEDTDYAFRARDAGYELRISAAEVFHQHHGVYRPPLNHVADVVVNARRFRDVHGIWPMDGWLRQFAQRGLIEWEHEGERLELVRLPTPEELHSVRDDTRAY